MQADFILIVVVLSLTFFINTLLLLGFCFWVIRTLFIGTKEQAISEELVGLPGTGVEDVSSYLDKYSMGKFTESTTMNFKRSDPVVAEEDPDIVETDPGEQPVM